MISISGGLIVTRASSDDAARRRVPEADLRQVAAADAGRAACWCALALFPGLPTIPFLLMGGGLGTIGLAHAQERELATDSWQPTAETPAAAPPRRISKTLLQGGAAGHRGRPRTGAAGGRRRRIRRCCGASRAIRRQLATDLGLHAAAGAGHRQPVAERAREYVDLAQRRRDRALRDAAGMRAGDPVGQASTPRSRAKPTREPAFGMPAHLDSDRPTPTRARTAGYTVVDPVSVHGHASLGTDPPPRPRAVLAAGRQETAGPRRRRATRRSSRIWCRSCSPLRRCSECCRTCCASASRFATPVSILEALGEAAGVHPQSDSADRVRAAGDPPRRGQAVSEPGGRTAGVSSSTRRSSRPIECAVEHGEQNSHLTLAPQHNSRHPEPHVRAVSRRRRRQWWRSRRPARGTSCGRSRRPPCRTCSLWRTTKSHRGCGCSRWGQSRDGYAESAPLRR